MWPAAAPVATSVTAPVTTTTAPTTTLTASASERTGSSTLADDGLRRVGGYVLHDTLFKRKKKLAGVDEASVRRAFLMADEEKHRKLSTFDYNVDRGGLHFLNDRGMDLFKPMLLAVHVIDARSGAFHPSQPAQCAALLREQEPAYVAQLQALLQAAGEPALPPEAAITLVQLVGAKLQNTFVKEAIRSVHGKLSKASHVAFTTGLRATTSKSSAPSANVSADAIPEAISDWDARPARKRVRANEDG